MKPEDCGDGPSQDADESEGMPCGVCLASLGAMLVEWGSEEDAAAYDRL